MPARRKRLCGLLLALAVFAKTSGALLAIAPSLAIVMLGRPRCWRAYLRPLLASFVAGLLVSAPLLLGVRPLLQQVAIHTGASASGGAPATTGRGLLLANLQVSAGWMESFVGNRFLLVVGIGLALTLLFRQRALLFLTLLAVLPRSKHQEWGLAR